MNCYNIVLLILYDYNVTFLEYSVTQQRIKINPPVFIFKYSKTILVKANHFESFDGEIFE